MRFLEKAVGNNIDLLIETEDSITPYDDEKSIKKVYAKARRKNQTSQLAHAAMVSAPLALVKPELGAMFFSALGLLPRASAGPVSIHDDSLKYDRDKLIQKRRNVEAAAKKEITEAKRVRRWGSVNDLKT